MFKEVRYIRGRFNIIIIRLRIFLRVCYQSAATWKNILTWWQCQRWPHLLL